MAELPHDAVTVAGVPVLLYVRGSPERAAGRGTVLFYHGFGGTKDRVAGYAQVLATAGFLVVCPDAAGHGDRRYRDFDLRFSDARWETEYDATESDFLRLIDKSAAEVPDIIDGLIARGWAGAGRLRIGGRSLGGNIAYAAVLADPRLRAMTSVVGSPEWTLPREHSPAPAP
ncbi:MAG: alpha/beta fold hydrolase [Streptosporangiaceae bacterium]